MLQDVNERIDQTGSTQTGSKHTGGDDDTHHVGVALAHTVEEALGEFLRVCTVNSKGEQQGDHGTQDHGLCHTHLDDRQPDVTDNEDRDRNERHDSLKSIRLEGFFFLLNFGSGFNLFTLVVAQNHADDEQTDNQDGAAEQRPNGVVGDEVHHVNAGHFSNERVVRRTRREVRTDRTTHHGSGSGGRLNTGTQHHRDQRRTHGSSTTCGRRNSDVNEEGHSRADRDQEDAQTADRSGQVVNETAVTFGVICNESKTHRRADCHHQRIIGHGLSKRIQSAHRVHRHQAEHEASGEEHEARFQSFDQGIYR